MIEMNARDLCEVVQFFVSCIARAHLMTIYTRDLKWLIACLHTWRSCWRGFAFGEDLLHIAGTTWPVLSSRSTSSSGVTLSMGTFIVAILPKIFSKCAKQAISHFKTLMMHDRLKSRV